MDSYTLDPLADDLTAREGTEDRVFLVLNGAHAWDIGNDPQARGPAALLALAWKVGKVDLSKWVSADVTPRYRHDCTQCAFLGRIGERDAWLAQHGSEDSLILRHGSDGPEYASMPRAFRRDFASHAGDDYAHAEALAENLEAFWVDSDPDRKCPSHDLRTCYCP